MQIIGGIHRSRKLKSPQEEGTRPSASQLRETLFNICQWDIAEAHFLDLFAGVGAIGLEALSRGAATAVFVDKERHASRTIQENIALLKEEKRSTVYCRDVFQALAFFVKRGESFDLIFADPPYGQGFSHQLLQFVDAHPNLLREGGSLFLEDEKDDQITSLVHLHLKSSRRVGRATLCHYSRLIK